MVSKRTVIVFVVSASSAFVLAACNQNSGHGGQSTSAAPASSVVAGHGKSSARAASFAVASVETGSTVDSGGHITASTTTFSPSNTIYAAVTTTGQGSGKLEATWTYQKNGQTLKQETKPASSTGSRVTTFAFSNAGGLPSGKYKIEISLNGTPVEGTSFSVQ